jgi:hypothetical protein
MEAIKYENKYYYNADHIHKYYHLLYKSGQKPRRVIENHDIDKKNVRYVIYKNGKWTTSLTGARNSGAKAFIKKECIDKLIKKYKLKQKLKTFINKSNKNNDSDSEDTKSNEKSDKSESEDDTKKSKKNNDSESEEEDAKLKRSDNSESEEEDIKKSKNNDDSESEDAKKSMKNNNLKLDDDICKSKDTKNKHDTNSELDDDDKLKKNDSDTDDNEVYDVKRGDNKTGCYKLPKLLKLRDEDKFKNEDGKILDVEIRGKRRFNQCFFRVKHVADAFKLPNLNKAISNKTSNYIKGKDKDYVLFTCIITKTSGGDTVVTNYESGKKAKVGRRSPPQKVMFLTYMGLLHVLFVSRNTTAHYFQSWSAQILFTAQMGSTDDKKRLSSTLL